MKKRQNISSPSPWEPVVGYSRAVRIGDTVYVSGTIATDENGLITTDDAYEQTMIIFQKIENALQQAGGQMRDVVRSRMFVTDITKWQEVGRAHAFYFKDIRPAATMVEVKALIDPQAVVEIEVTAVITSP